MRVRRVVGRTLCVAVVALGCRGVAGADDAPGMGAAAAPGAGAPAADVELTTWDGFLWKDRESRLRIGELIVDEQVMLGAPRVVADPVAKALAPLVSALDEEIYAFGFDLAGRDERAIERVPRYVVRVRGRVVVTGSTDPVSIEASSVQTMHDARLVAVEALDRPWLVAWRELLDYEASVRNRSKDGPPASVDVRKKALEAACRALKAMRATAAPGDAAYAEVRKVESKVRSISKFRHATEATIERSILAEAKSLGVRPPDSFAETSLPPAPWTTKDWFADAKTLAEFLARAAKEWTGEPEDLDVVHYVSDGHGSTWMELADLETIRATWTEARYARIRAATVGVK